MAGEQYRHIFLRGRNSIYAFTNPRKGGSEPRIPRRNRREHSAHLRQRLDEAWVAFDRQQRAVVQIERENAYLEFQGEPGFELMVKSLENIGSGIRLLNVRVIGEGEAQRIYATVLVPISKRGYFLRKLQAYANEIDGRSNKPKNAKLVNSISDIRLAVLGSFWQDDPELLPGSDPIWIEVWLSNEIDTVDNRFGILLNRLEIDHADGFLRFPERSVMLIRANRNQMTRLVISSDDIAEFRLAKEITALIIELGNQEQLNLVREMLARLNFDGTTDIAICILDTGINNGHPLIQPILDSQDLHAVDPTWGTFDHYGHGTLMAGTAAYGDLAIALNNRLPIVVNHRLESVKILPPSGQNQRKLWGLITAQGISRAEIQAPQRKRIICMAITSPDNLDRGRPSSWSAMLDKLSSGSDEDNIKYRLIVVSGGNVDNPNNWLNYPDDNLTNEIHDPGQAWNALTVGAFTQKTQITNPYWNGFSPKAPADGLSPFSTTSTAWPQRKRPIKPDVVFEGGNVAIGPNNSAVDIEDLKLLSTFYRPQIAQFAPFCATSAASAQASRMAAQIQAKYPEAWPETIRALIVHTAEWTDTMRNQFITVANPTKQDYLNLLRICGYGVPNLERALYCSSNSLTLISQAELQPFDKRDGQPITRDMHLYDLPWPSDILANMGQTLIKMRLTLSYFIEPGPGEVGWKDRYRYPSYGLRFDVNGPGESEREFISRVNSQARDDDYQKTVGPTDKWLIGESRNMGSIHSDIWRGTAAELSTSNKIAIYPAVGWWRERSYLNRWNKRCRYSLIVSIYTPELDVDIYTPVAIQVGIPITVGIPSRTRRSPR